MTHIRGCAKYKATLKKEKKIYNGLEIIIEIEIKIFSYIIIIL